MEKSKRTKVVTGTETLPTQSQTLKKQKLDLGEVQLPSVLVGRVVAVLKTDQVLVDFPANTSGELVPSRSLLPLAEANVGNEVLLAFENGDPGRPIILGFLHSPEAASPPTRELRLDEDRLVLTAKQEVVIQCGKSSITLTKAGKVLVRGAYLLSRSSGVNRIKGGSVQIN